MLHGPATKKTAVAHYWAMAHRLKTPALSCARVHAHIYAKLVHIKKDVRTQDFRSENLFFKGLWVFKTKIEKSESDSKGRLFLEIITFSRRNSKNQSQ